MPISQKIISLKNGVSSITTLKKVPCTRQINYDNDLIYVCQFSSYSLKASQHVHLLLRAVRLALMCNLHIKVVTILKAFIHLICGLASCWFDKGSYFVLS